MKTSKAPRKEAAKNKPTLVAFLLDRTGSMADCKDETIKGFNGYIDELRKNGSNGTMRLTLTQFDTISVDILHDAVPLKEVNHLNGETYQPRGGTPLYDAIGKTVRETETAAGSKYKVLFVTLTDGQENSSSEWTSTSIKALIKEKEDKDHWTFAHIGVGASGWDATRALSAGTLSSSNVHFTTAAKTGDTYRRLATMTAAYACNTGNAQTSAQNVWGKEDEKDEK